MTLSSMPATPGARALRRARAGLAALGALAALAGLASCGGGTTQYEAFVPGRYFALGDETSSMDRNGRKYGVNGLNADGRLDCSVQPNWVQQMASSYGFAFVECNPGFLPDTKAIMLAQPGAKVADVAAQVEQQVISGGFRDRDLATVLAGSNDILELYGQYPARSEEGLLADARARGERLAQIVNRLVGLGVKVVVSDLPDVGLTPFGQAETLAFTGTPRATLLSRLTSAFNEQLGVKVLLDGRFVGLVQANLTFQALNRAPTAFGLANVSTAACTAVQPLCTTATLLPEAVTSSYLWADDTRMGPPGQGQLAQLAIERSRRNPF
jgi:hypothetical protein